MFRTFIQYLTRNRKQPYIKHIEDGDGGVSYFGPFKANEIDAEMQSGYAKLLVSVGRLETVEMTNAEARKIWINSRKWWKGQ